MSISNISHDCYIPPEGGAEHAAVRKDLIQRIVDWIVSHFTEFFAFIEGLFVDSDSEWEPMPNSDFQAILKIIRRDHLRNIVLTKASILGEKGAEPLNREEKTALLERVEQVKRDFYHKCLDGVSGIPSNLDGNTSGDSLIGFLFDLQTMKREHPDDPSIEEMIETFKETYKFVVEREAVNRLKDKREKAFRKKEYVQKVQDRLKSLKVGERFVYQVSVSGHAMLFEFKAREQDGNRVLDIKLFNSGDGVENHYSKSFLAAINPYAKFQTYLIEGSDLDMLAKSDFVSKLIEQEVPGEVKGRHVPIFGYVASLCSSLYHEVAGVGKIYKLLKVHAIRNGEGKKVVSDDPRMHHFPQNRGTCSRRVYELWMRENLDSDAEYQQYLAETVKCAVTRLELAEAVENNLRQTTVKVDSLKYRLFVKPHWFSKGVACLRNRMHTRTMILIGEKYLKQF